MHRRLYLNMRTLLRSDQDLEWIVQRGCGVSLPGDIPELSGCNLVPCVRRWLLQQAGGTR